MRTLEILRQLFMFGKELCNLLTLISVTSFIKEIILNTTIYFLLEPYQVKREFKFYVFWLAENFGVGFAIYTSCLYSLTLWADLLFAYTIAPSTPTPLLVFLCNYSLPIKKFN